jgi:glutathione S-transferase
MFLIGQYDSPFVRRVAIALRLYGLAFEHRPWSTFGDADKIAPYNPLRRVPTLVLDGGEALIESTIILDYLDELVGPEAAMLPRSGVERRRHLRICALASGLGDKAVSLLYERVLRKEQLALWVERCQAQIGDVLKVLEAERAKVATPYWLGDRIGHADIASLAKRIRSCSMPRAIRRSRPTPIVARRWPRSRRSCSRWRRRRGETSSAATQTRS